MDWKNIFEGVIIDSVETWPDELKIVLDKNKYLIISYLEEQKRIDKDIKDDLFKRISPEKNRYEFEIMELYQRLDDILDTCDIIGFHCSRLLPYEIDNILLNGIQPLSFEFVDNKITTLYKHGYINSEHKKILINDNNSNESSRINRVYTISCMSSLNSTGGIENFFRYWGGEAIFSRAIHYDCIKENILKLGTPSIVVCKLHNSDSFNNVKRFVDRFIKYYLVLERYIDDEDFDVEISHSRSLNVDRIITKDMELFESITGYSLWGF